MGSLWIGALGHFGLDPRLAVSLPVMTIPQGTGITNLQINIPNDPRLRGLLVSFQALIADPAASQQLSNTIAEKIL